ncbi:MAG: PIN domain-containing protein [Boseongicola sp.]|nr:PIN domain-containing protein [Boseongicola sp.]
MKVLIDACVLYPTLLRELVIGATGLGQFEPLWSERIFAEWRATATRNNHTTEAEIAISDLNQRFPNALVPEDALLETRLSLPDENDIHVLAAAITGGAGELLTLNVKDFPARTLAKEGILLREPDGFLLEQYHGNPEDMRAIVDNAMATAGSYGVDVSNPRRLLKRARVPRLGKALYAS